jgi:glycosyltransferase involved in cell wall biosynthesis
MLGHLEGDDLTDAYEQADVLVVPSLYEPWGLVVHEGLAYGLPVVTTDEVGAADDLIEHGKNGFVVPAGGARQLAEAMTTAAGWTSAQRALAADTSARTLASCSLDRAVEGFMHASRLAMEHAAVRRGRAR